MEICSFYEHWQRKVWFSSIHALVALIMVSSFASFQGIPSTSVAMETEIYEPSVAVEAKNHPPTTENSPHPSQPPPGEPDEEGFWAGVDEVDLTVPFEEEKKKSEEEDLEESLYFFFYNESFFTDVDCEVFSSMTPPPLWIDLPPPPLPPFLAGPNYDLRNYDVEDDDEDDKEKEPSIYPEGRAGEDECRLCQWAAGGNQTLDFFAKASSEGDGNSTKNMIGIMVGVAIISAAIGAAIMSFLLKCRRNTGDPSCLINSCPVVIQRRGRSKSSDPRKRNGNNEAAETSQVQSSKSDSSPGVGWHLKMWKRNTPQAPINACSSPVSESSYIEDQYVNCETGSAVYAELNTDEGLALKRTQISDSTMSNTYSEIANGELPSELNASSQREQNCNNGGYIASEPDRNGSCAGSTSTPSSAYYSDVSSYDFYSNAKGKLKTIKPENITSVPDKQYNIKSVSNGIEFHPVRQDMLAVNFDHHSLNGSTVPPSLQLLPKQLNTDHKYLLNSIPNYPANITPPLNYILDGMHKCTDECPHLSQPNGHPQPSYGHYEGIYEENVMPVRHYTGINKPLTGISNQRPLPALPSRRINGPKKKRYNAHPEHGVQPLETNYV